MTSSRVRTAALLVGIVVVLEAVVFGRYFLGLAIPPADFLGGYNTDAYAWWHDGGLPWSAQRLAGFPTALNLQSSSWYLPVGIVAAITPFTLWASSVLSALHVAFGFAGTYVLLRRIGLDAVPSTLGAVAGFFAVGYYTNAEHLDIARSYAWVPWLLLVLSPRFPWRRFWAIPVAALILWQAVVAMYPGITVSAVYIGVAWIVYWQLRDRPRVTAYLVPLAAAGIIAALLLGPKIIPYLFINSHGLVQADESIFTPEMIGTLLFGYEGRFLPNSPSMRSFFVPATVLALVFFVRPRLPAAGAGLVVAVPALLLGIPLLPWFQAAQHLPGLTFSRFTMSDFKIFLVVGLVILAAAGLQSILQAAPRLPVLRWALLVVFAGLLAALGIVGRFTIGDWLPGFLVFAVVIAVVGAVVVLRRRSARALRAASISLVALTAVSGTVWALSNDFMWSQDREAIEQTVYGSTVEELLGERSAAALEQRPARTPLNDRTDDIDIFSARWNRGAYSGEYTVGGYVQPKAFPTQARMLEVLKSTSGERFEHLLAAPGALIPMATALPDPELVTRCAITGDCGALQQRPLAYAPGEFSFSTTSTAQVEVSLNEAYYDGWHATACAADGSACSSLEVRSDDWGLVHLTVPAGDLVIRLEYSAPGVALGWIALYSGLGLALLSVAVTLGLSARRRSRSTPAP